MAYERYQYETSPRKLEPNYNKKNKKRENFKIVEDIPRQQIKVSQKQRKKQFKSYCCWAIFVAINHKL